MISMPACYNAGDTIYFPFDTYAGSTGASVTISGLAVTDIEVYKNGSMTQRASDNGYTLLDTDGIDLDGATGFHGFKIDTSDNSDAGFWADGSTYIVLVNAITVDGQTVLFSYLLPVGFLLRPTTAGRKLDVSSGGEAGVDWANVGSPTTTLNLSGTSVKTATDVETDTQDIQSRLPAALSGGFMKADMLAVSTDSTAADNFETMLDGTGGQTFYLKQLRMVNSAGPGFYCTSSQAAGYALYVQQSDADGTAFYCEGGFDGFLALGTNGAGAAFQGGNYGLVLDGAGVADLKLAGGIQKWGSTTQVSTNTIDAKTTNLPAAPASTTNITAGTITTVTNLTNSPSNGDLTATMKASVTTAASAATPAVTVSDKTGFALTSGERNSIATALLDLANGVETSITLRQAARIMLAALAGKVDGAAGTTMHFRDQADGKNRITVTVDADGNRTALTFDLT